MSALVLIGCSFDSSPQPSDRAMRPVMQDMNDADARQDASTQPPQAPQLPDSGTSQPPEAPRDASITDPGEARDADVMMDAASAMDAAGDATTADAAKDAAQDAAQDAATGDEDAAVDETDPGTCDDVDDVPACVCPHDPRAEEQDPCAPPLCAIGDCAPDDHCRYLTFASASYYFCDDERTWEQARERCAAVPGLHLVTVDDADEDAFVMENVSDKTWLGGSDGAREGRWRWTDATIFYDDDVTNGAYVNWHRTEPNNIGLSNTPSDCLLLWYENLCWADASCGDEHGYVCEVER